MDKKLNTNIPAKNLIFTTYENYVPFLEKIMRNIKAKLKANLKLSSQPTYKERIKSFNSYYKKLLRLKPQEAANASSLVCLTDMMGIRIICTFIEDVTDVTNQIKKLFNVKEVEIKGSNQSFKEFGYESIHVLIDVPEDCFPKEDFFDESGNKLVLPKEAVCEIQIRTILQDAWAEVEHELIYKTEFTPFDMPLKRKLASMNASLSLADIIFQEIRDYQKNLQLEMNERHKTFYEKADEFIGETAITPVKENTKIERINPYVKGTIDDLLLEAIQAHNSQELDKAVSIYTTIIDSNPKPNNQVLSIIYKHRGMAYFSKNDFENALSDFDNAFNYDNKSFRTVYYKGIVYSILKQYKDAIDSFTQSLEINEYQSHTYFRRALAYFELGEYENSLNDLVSAQRLGLNDEGVKNLNNKLVEKFGMKM